MNAAAQQQGEVTREHGLHLLEQMLRIRCFEDRCAQLYGESRIRGFLHLYNGEEAVAVGVMQALAPQDAIVGTYREHGHAIVRGILMRKLMAELFGKVSGCCRGRGGSMHIFDAATRFYGGNAIVAGGLPLATGLALAEKLQKRAGIAVCFFGEGATAEGEFHESMNLAALWGLPILFVDEGWRSVGLAAEIGMRLMEQAFYDLDAPVQRVCSAEVPVPYAKHMEDAALPQVAQIVATVEAMLAHAK